MPVVFLVTIAVVVASRMLRHAFGISRLAVGGTLLAAAVLLWLAANRPHADAMRRAALELSRPGGTSRGVPRWIEQLRNLALALALAGLIPLVDDLVPE